VHHFSMGGLKSCACRVGFAERLIALSCRPHHPPPPHKHRHNTPPGGGGGMRAGGEGGGGGAPQKRGGGEVSGGGRGTWPERLFGAVVSAKKNPGVGLGRAGLTKKKRNCASLKLGAGLDGPLGFGFVGESATRWGGCGTRPMGPQGGRGKLEKNKKTGRKGFQATAQGDPQRRGWGKKTGDWGSNKKKNRRGWGKKKKRERGAGP